MSAKTMMVAGIMSGTSADGIDVAVVEITPRKPRVKLSLVAHEGFAFPAALRRAVLAAMNAASTSTAELARLNWRLGLAYAEAVSVTLERHAVKLDLIGCHGQTLYHQPCAESYAGRSFGCTWQLGEAAVIAATAGGLCAICRPETWARAAEYRRHRQLDRHSRWGVGRRGNRLRQRPRKYGDRCTGAEALQQEV
jgi:1,6-anhydro-N-acetylmuramate kinase